MVKSILIDDAVHERILTTQDIIQKKYKAKMNISSMIDKLFNDPEEVATLLFERK